MATDAVRSVLMSLGVHVFRVRDHIADLWRSSGLLTQFLFLIVLILWSTTQITSFVQRGIAARNMVESSLEVEQALARSILVPLIGQEPLTGTIDPAIRTAIDNVLESSVEDGYINLIKLWGLDGRLLYSSEGGPLRDYMMDPQDMRVYDGETVINQLDLESVENEEDVWIGDHVYEVYMPMYNTAGELIVIAEIYCSVELLVARIERMVGEIDRIRTIVIVVGIILLSLLILFAQRRLTRQENKLLDVLKEQEALTLHNSELLDESEGLRRALADENDRFLNHVGAELHDGPIQLLSLSSLYQSQVPIDPKHVEAERKARELVSQALSDLRNISVGLILPELEGASLLESVRLAIDAFEDETDIHVPRRLDGEEVFADKPLQVVAYRTVYESLNNAKKHANGKGIFVDAKVTSKRLTIEIRNEAPQSAKTAEGAAKADPGASGISLGIIGMAKRSRSVGGQLSVSQEGDMFRVRLSLPLKVRNRRPLTAPRAPIRRRA
ncbi:sensor histidine kinase [Maritimibacter sp. DP1N21-5]|uniref:sensor histidine kinase n=1 Tax=Maritimibacter sp. DP1N21-5 TaxID=2836867 RepID=UPI001C47C33C|nr:hypothetical protein [Maritimibacter sp. DP1N21-5]MBV7407550.1 hypothetical protein [Maritimibacter sp. DP1N21-5]